MGVKEVDDETIFQRSTNSAQEVSGWKVFIFLPQNTIWQFLIIYTVIGKCANTVIRAAYGSSPLHYEIVDGILNAIYCADVILATVHAIMGNVRKLRHGDKKHPLFILLDFLSLLPLQFIYNNTVYGTSPKDDKIGHYLSLVGVLRIYQVPRNFMRIKKSVYEMKVYLIIIVIQVLSYTVIITFLVSCFMLLTLGERGTKECFDDLLDCVMENLRETYYLFFQSVRLRKFLYFKLNAILTYMIAAFTFGYLYTFLYLIPLFVFAAMRYLVKDIAFCRKLKHIKILVENKISEKKLRKRILKYFNELLLFERSDEEPELMNVLPLCMKKNIFTDMHWEAFRHSYLLQDLSIGCKRSLAVGMKKEFLLPSTKIFEKGKNSTYFIYLESGVLQIMAEENNRVPVLSLTAGTVVGEMSFFLNKKSPAFVRASEYSIIQVLPLRHFFRVLVDYPNDMKQILHKKNVRLELAKSTHNIKTKIFAYFSFERGEDKGMEQTKWGNIKWIKGQSRAISNLHKAEKLFNLHQDTTDDYEQWIVKLSTQMKHTSVNLPLLCVKDENEYEEGGVCLKTFPWLIDPECQFVFVWKKIILIVALITLLVYPTFIAWSPRIPYWFFVLSCVVSFFYTIDVMVYFMTSTKINNTVTKKFSSVAIQKFYSFYFYLDVASAIPIHVVMYYVYKGPYESNLFFVNVLLKVYVLVPAINYWNYSPKPLIFVRTILKYLFFLLTSIYIAASIFHLFFTVELLFDAKGYTCSISTQVGFEHVVSCNFLMAIYLCLQIPVGSFGVGFVVQSVTLFLFILSQTLLLSMTVECIASYVLDLTCAVEYKLLMDFIFQYMGKNKMRKQVRDRVIGTMEFQWLYDKKNYITEERIIWDILPYYLREDVDLKFVLPVLAKSRLFASEDKPFLMDLCKRATLLVLPANSVLLTLGNQSKCLYVIQKGFVQINSFIAGDLHLNVSRPICAKEGDTFPVIDVFSQTPSAVTAVTATDCELLLLDLEDVISAMMIHGIFRDFVETVNNTDLSKLTTAKLGVSSFKDVFRENEAHRKKVFDTVKGLGVVLRYLLKERAINSESNGYRLWELIRVLFILFYVIMWPLALGCPMNINVKSNLIKSLFFTELLVFCIDFYIRIHVAYYNKIGIYVTHTLFTTLHYLMTAFITDIVAFSPNFHVLHLIITKAYDVHWFVIVANMLLRSLSLYRFVALLEYHGQNGHATRYVIAFSFIGLILHYYITMKVHFVLKSLRTSLEISLVRKDYLVPKTGPERGALELYLHSLAVVLALAMKCDFTVSSFRDSTTANIGLMATLGLMGQIWLYSHLILQSTISNKSLRNYQHYMRSFINFLTRQKAEDEVIHMAVEHFEYEWQQKHGRDMNQILSELPQTLREDILFPLYCETLSGVRCLDGANEYFYRTLSINIEEMFLKEGSIIIFQQEVQKNIFFIQRGKCIVENLSQVLFKGAMIGDIKRQGIMENRIIAKTNVQLLKIPSDIFFLTLDNFYETKMNYLVEVATAADFIPSIYYESPSEYQGTNLPEKEMLECEFVSSFGETYEKKSFIKKAKTWRMKSKSKIVRCFAFLSMIVAYITILVIPVLMSVRLYTTQFLSIVYALDGFWLAKIVFFEFVSDPDDVKKDLKRKHKKKRIMRNVSRILFNVLTVFPIEVLPFAIYGFQLTDYCCYIMCNCYVNRLLRIFYIFQYFRNRGQGLLVNFSMNVLGILMLKVAIVNFTSALNIRLHLWEVFDRKCYQTLDEDQIAHSLNKYLCTVEVFVSSKIEYCMPKNFFEAGFNLVTGIFSVFVKAFFINHTLMLFYISQHYRSSKMTKIEQLDRYLTVRDVSPFLRNQAKKYFCNLLDAFYEGTNPTFLNRTPSFIKTYIMENLYVSHLKNCFAFQNLDDAFLKQLTTRMSLNVFFPGDYITEKGDVDHNMYFIQAGEVFCIETDSHYKALEKVTDVYTEGEYFGVLQGILPAYPQTHTRRAKTLARLLVLNYYKWEDLRTAFPDDLASIINRCMQSLA